LADQHNPLNDQDNPKIPGWSVAICVVALPLLVMPAVWLARRDGTLAIIIAFFLAALLAVIIAVAPLGRRALPALGFRAVGWRPMVLGALATIVLSVAVSQIGLDPKGMKQAVETARDPGLFALSLLALAGLAPLVEEMLFRGILYGWLAWRWGGAVAWIASSLAFAAAHVELAHIILVLPLGLWFGWLRRRTDSLWPSLVAHAVNNGFAIAAAALLGI
jgi:membrane protease YdiL (CAAX protease family)